MSKPKKPGDLQLAILGVLWHRTEAAVATVHRDLEPARRLALTTIATMLRKMEARGLVDHRVEGRQFIYRAAVEAGEVHRDMVTDVVDRAFAGDASALVSHLLQEGAFEPGDLSELRRMIAVKERELACRDAGESGR